MSELKDCPFCGKTAVVQVQQDSFQIVGCSNSSDRTSSMLCPNPSLVIYKDTDGKWDYRWWNRRAQEGK